MLDLAEMRSIGVQRSFQLRGRGIMAAVTDIGAGHISNATSGARSRALLSLDEVRASALPAYFYDYSEELLYLDGQLFDLRDVEAAERAGVDPLPLPREILENGVGLEYGWRHVAGCACHCCRQRALEAAGEAAQRPGEAVA
jgi:hypothetical protein